MPLEYVITIRRMSLIQSHSVITKELGVQFVDFRHYNLMTPKFMSYIQTCVSNGFWNVKEAFETTYEQT